MKYPLNDYLDPLTVRLRSVMEDHYREVSKEQAARVEGYALAILAATGGSPQDYTLTQWFEYKLGVAYQSWKLTPTETSAPDAVYGP